MKWSKFRIVGPKPKPIKLPAQKSPSRFSSLDARDMADKAARKKFGKDWFDKDTSKPALTGMSTKSLTDMAVDSYAIKAEGKMFFKTLNKELKVSRLKTAGGIKGKKFKIKTPTAPTFKQQKAGIFKGSGLPKSKPALKAAKSKGAFKALGIANKKSQAAFTKITEKYTTRTKASKFKNRTKPIKRLLTSFEGEKAQSVQRSLDQGYEPFGYYSGMSKSGRISKRYAKFLDRKKKK
tara:strand:- start:1566 stop:2273 length:708 start_codon:yes stop_codon:yes gene_type:complete